MKVVVCVRRLTNGELNPFDACCYEAALRMQDAEVTLLSMGPMSVKEFLLGLTRLGAKKAVLLSDPAFAGADTLATAYALSLAIKKLSPDLILCGRQTVDGDTGQVGPELAAMLGIELITNVIKLEAGGEGVSYETRSEEKGTLQLPSLLTVERINTLRLPSIRSRLGEIAVWTAEDIGADKARCGLAGSPTRVMASFKNEQDRRKCRFIPLRSLPEILQTAFNTPRVSVPQNTSEAKLSNVWIVGEAPREMALSVSEQVTVVKLTDPGTMAEMIKEGQPEAVLWASDLESKKIAPQVAALLQTGLCADCIQLETDGKRLFMYRPAFSGDIIAKIQCLTRPQMATVRTLSENKSRIAVGIGYGAKDCIERAVQFANRIQAEVVASRKMVDQDCLPYEKQVGLTGKSVNPDVYLALGISGAVHHIAGMKQSGTVVAVNPDRQAPIFDYADYGILCSAEELLDGWTE